MTAHLNGKQGNSPVIAARIRQADHDRLAVIAEIANCPLSRVIRVALEYGLVEVETKGLPDDAAQDQQHDAPAD